MNLKRFLPVDNFKLKSELSIEEIRRRITEIVASGRVFRFTLFKKKITKPYEGKTTGDTFRISRVINYRNSFLPLIIICITGYAGQTVIAVKMRMFLPVIIFMCFWLGIIVLVCMLLPVAVFFKVRGIMPVRFSFTMLIPYFMLLIGWGVMLFAFKYESKKSKQFLISLSEGEEIVKDDKSVLT